MPKERESGRILGELLRRAREDAGLTQSALARRASMAPNHLVRLESGEKTTPRFETVARLATELGVSLDDLSAACGYRTPTSLTPASAAAAVAAMQALNGFLRTAAEAQTKATEAVAVLQEHAGRAIAKSPKRQKRRKRPRS